MQNVCRGGPHTGSGHITCDEGSGSSADILVDPGSVNIDVRYQHPGHQVPARGYRGIEFGMTAGSILTKGSSGHGLFADHQGASGSVLIIMSGGSVETRGSGASVLCGRMAGSSGDIVIRLTGGSALRGGVSSLAVLGHHTGTGNVTISMSDDATLRTTSGTVPGLGGNHTGTGNVTVSMTGGPIMTTGAGLTGTQGSAALAGNVTIALAGANSVVKTTGSNSPGLNTSNTGPGNATVTMSDGLVETSGAGQGALVSGLIPTIRGRAPQRCPPPSLKAARSARGAGLLQCRPRPRGLRREQQWARMESYRGKWKAEASTSGKESGVGLEHRHRRHGLQVGWAGALGEEALVGVSLHHRRGSAEVSEGGDLELSGTGAGVSGTWGREEVYVDVQAEVTGYEADLTSSRRGVLKKDVSGHGHALGVEAGRRLALERLPAGVVLTPRAGLVHSRVSVDAFSDAVGARVTVDGARSLKGRVGVEAEVKLVGSPGSRVFGSVEVEHEFSTGRKVRVSGRELKSEADATWLRLDLDGTHTWEEGRYTLQGGVGYATSGGSHEFGGGVSLNLRF